MGSYPTSVTIEAVHQMRLVYCVSDDKLVVCACLNKKFFGKELSTSIIILTPSDIAAQPANYGFVGFSAPKAIAGFLSVSSSSNLQSPM